MSQRELGAYLGLSRENVSRQLGLLRDAGAISVSGTDITITDKDVLAALASKPAAD